MASNIQQTTFWNFLKKRKIEIPIIQRDYAQGRVGKEKLREKFLADLKMALDREGSGKDSFLKLDFVYGSVEHKRFNPLDGQQRLTTLWLLHWYIAFKAGKLQDVKKTLKNFTYETRATSREFCNHLSDLSFPANSDEIAEAIQNQTWFFSSWKQDPTIRAMLNMLGGGKNKNEDQNEIKDGLEKVFDENSNYQVYWEKLSGENCPIVFYYLDILDLTLSDDLYIKMNSRGKSLTSFENFKADLVGYINKENIERSELPPGRSFAHLLDTKWTDIFWKNKSQKSRIDEIYYAFFNRYFLNKLLAETNISVEEIEANKLFKHLYGKKGNDTKVSYTGFDVYTIDSKLGGNINSIKKFLNRFHDAFADTFAKEGNTLFLPGWNVNSNFKFIPEYAENESITTLSQPQRVVFYAICCYLEKGEYNEAGFQKWMRVVWNIVENANIDTLQSMVSAIRLMNDLADHSHDIYEHLCNRDISNDFAKAQMEEEREKAKQILQNPESKDSKDISREDKIIEAENTAFFKGAIRFLFRTGVNEYDWSVFDDRFKKSVAYFKENGVKEIYGEDAVFLRVLVSKFSRFEHFKGEIFDENASSWKSLLINESRIDPINELFEMGIDEVSNFDFEDFNSAIANNEKLKILHEALCKSTVIKQFSPRSYFHWWNRDTYSIFPHNTKSQKKIFVLGDKRNEVISALEKDDIICVERWQKVDDLPYYRGWHIYFKLKDNPCEYRWWNGLSKKSENGEWDNVPDVTLATLSAYLFEQIERLD